MNFVNVIPCRKLGWESVPGESNLNALLRGEVLRALATFDHDKTHEEALNRFQSLVNDKNVPLVSADTNRVIELLEYVSLPIPYRPFRIDMKKSLICYCRLFTLQLWGIVPPQTGKVLNPCWIFIEKPIQCKWRKEFCVRFTKHYIWNAVPCLVCVKNTLQFCYMFWLCTGCLATSPDPDIVVEVLNFLLSDEVLLCAFKVMDFKSLILLASSKLA